MKPKEHTEQHRNTNNINKQLNKYKQIRTKETNTHILRKTKKIINTKGTHGQTNKHTNK